MKKLSVLIFPLFCFLAACMVDDNVPIHSDDFASENCDILAIANNNLFKSESNFFYFIDSVSLEENCLLIGLQYSGCNQEIQALLVDEGVILESSPIQRNIKVVINTEITGCEPMFYKMVSFDLVPLQADNENQISFNLEGYNQALLYTY